MNPFLVLDVAVDATDAEVRAAYQKLLHRFSPERRPDEFQMVQEAYEKLRTVSARWEWRLLHLEDGNIGPLAAMDQFAAMPGRRRPPGAAAMRSFLRSCGTAAMREHSAPGTKKS